MLQHNNKKNGVSTRERLRIQSRATSAPLPMTRNQSMANITFGRIHNPPISGSFDRYESSTNETNCTRLHTINQTRFQQQQRIVPPSSSSTSFPDVILHGIEKQLIISGTNRNRGTWKTNEFFWTKSVDGWLTCERVSRMVDWCKRELYEYTPTLMMYINI